MFVIVQHQVKDPKDFFADVPAVAQNAPPGVHPRMFCAAEDKASAVCLWQADPVDSVRAYIDEVTGDASDNAYFEVNEGHSIGLPGSQAATSHSL